MALDLSSTTLAFIFEYFSKHKDDHPTSRQSPVLDFCGACDPLLSRSRPLKWSLTGVLPVRSSFSPSHSLTHISSFQCTSQFSHLIKASRLDLTTPELSTTHSALSHPDPI